MSFRLRVNGVLVAIAATFCLGGGPAGSARGGDHGSGAVYTLSNEAAGNQLVVFQRDHRGGLSLAGTVATGGLGLGTGLASQGGLLAFAKNEHVLYAVNAGSNDLSVDLPAGQERRLMSFRSLIQPGSAHQPDGSNGHTLCLNNGSAAGDIDQITGFTIHQGSGKLSLINNSTQGLSSGSVGPAQVQFNEDGKVLAVTKKTPTESLTFLVDRHGRAGGAIVQPSSGMTPYGFAFNKAGYLIVSEAVGGAAGASTVSSYSLNSHNGAIQVVSPSVATFQTAACWIAVTASGRYAYSSNTGSGNVTGFAVDGSGTLTRLSANGVTGVTGGAAIDSAIVGDSLLYVLSQGQAGGTVHRGSRSSMMDRSFSSAP